MANNQTILPTSFCLLQDVHVHVVILFIFPLSTCTLLIICSAVHLRYWLPVGQFRPPYWTGFVLGFHWLHKTVINFIVTCVRPDVWSLIGELGGRKGYSGVSIKIEVASSFEKVADCINKGPLVPFFLWRLGKV